MEGRTSNVITGRLCLSVSLVEKKQFQGHFSHPQEAGDPSTWKETPVPPGSPELWVMERQ